MDKLKEPECASIGRKVALWCALPAALVLLGIIVSKLLDLFLEPHERQQQNLVGGLLLYVGELLVLLGTLYLSAAFLGRRAGQLIYHRTRGVAGAIFVGICLALSCLLSVVVVWFIYNLIAAAIHDRSILGAALFFNSMVGFVVFAFGIVPAILLGMLYGILVRKRCFPVDTEA